MSRTPSRFSSSSRPLTHAKLLVVSGSHTLATLIDSGADDSFIDEELVTQLGIDRVLLPQPVPANALEGHLLGTVTHTTTPVHLLLSGNHLKTIQFHILPSPRIPIILRYSWLCRHNPT